MSEELGGLKIKIGLEGSEFTQGIQSINREMKVLETAFKNQGAGITGFGNSLDGLKSKSSMLNGQIDLQKQKFAALKDQLDKSIESTGEYSKNSQNLKIQLNNVEKSLKTLDSELKKTSTEIRLQSSNWTKLGNTMKSVSDKLKGVGEGLKNVGSKLSTTLTLPLAAAGAASFKMASDMVESINKVDTVFGENSKVVQDWSNTSLDKMGMAKASALEMSSLFGDMGSGMGLSSKDTLDYSMNLTRLSADLASFKNVRVDVAKTAVTGVYTGETESLKQLGIVMTQANLQEYAYSQGIKKKIQDMTQAEQVQLRYNYVMSVTKNAQGDFEKTSQSSSNQIKIFGEVMKELGTTIGTQLIPLITPFIQKLNQIVKNFSNMDEGTKKWIVVLGGIGAVIGPVIVVLGSIITAVSTVVAWFSACSVAIAAAGGVMAVLTGPVGIAIAVIAGLIAIGILLYKNWDEIKTKCSELGQNLSSTWNGIKTSISNIVTSIGTFVTTKFGSQIESTKKIFNALKDFFGAVWDLYKNIFLGAILIIIDIFTGNFGKLKTDVIQIMTNIKNSFKTIWESIKTIFKEYLSILFTTMKGFATDALSAMKTIASSIWDGIKSLPGEMLQFGKDIVQGLINGITSMISKVKEVAGNLADGISSKIRGALGINSPSRVMMEIGGYTTEGLALGIESQRDMVIDAIQGISTDIKVNRFTTALDSKASGSSSITIINQGTIVGTNGMKEFADMISRQISGNYGLSTGGVW